MGRAGKKVLLIGLSGVVVLGGCAPQGASLDFNKDGTGLIQVGFVERRPATPDIEKLPEAERCNDYKTRLRPATEFVAFPVYLRIRSGIEEQGSQKTLICQATYDAQFANGIEALKIISALLRSGSTPAPLIPLFNDFSLSQQGTTLLIKGTFSNDEVFPTDPTAVFGVKVDGAEFTTTNGEKRIDSTPDRPTKFTITQWNISSTSKERPKAIYLATTTDNTPDLTAALTQFGVDTNAPEYITPTTTTTPPPPSYIIVDRTTPPKQTKTTTRPPKRKKTAKRKKT
jgi:hypothetical protein